MGGAHIELCIWDKWLLSCDFYGRILLRQTVKQNLAVAVVREIVVVAPKRTFTGVPSASV